MLCVGADMQRTSKRSSRPQTETAWRQNLLASSLRGTAANTVALDVTTWHIIPGIVVIVQFTSGAPRRFECDDAGILNGLLVLFKGRSWVGAYTLKMVQWARLSDGTILRGEDYRADHGALSA